MNLINEFWNCMMVMIYIMDILGQKRTTKKMKKKLLVVLVAETKTKKRRNKKKKEEEEEEEINELVKDENSLYEIQFGFD